MAYFNCEINSNTRKVDKEAKRLRISLIDNNQDLIGDIEKVKSIANNILEQENIELNNSKLISSLIIERENENSVKYNFNGRVGTIEINSESVTKANYVSKIVKAQLPTIDIIELDSSITGLIKRFFAFIIALFLNLFGKISSEQVLRFKKYGNVQTSTDLIDAFSMFGKSLESVHSEMAPQAKIIQRSVKYSRDLELALRYLSSDKCDKLISSVVQKSSTNAIEKLKQASIGDEFCADVFVLNRVTTQILRPVIISYYLIKTGDFSFDVKIKVVEEALSEGRIEKTKTEQKESSFTKSIILNAETVGQNIDLKDLKSSHVNKLSSFIASSMVGLLYDYNSKAMIGFDHFQDLKALFEENASNKEFKLFSCLGKEAMKENFGWVEEKRTKQVFSRVNKSFYNVIKDMLPLGEFSKIDSLQLYAIYLHSYLNFVEQYSSKGLLVGEIRDYHLAVLKQAKIEYSSMARSAYRLGDKEQCTDLFLGSEIIMKIDDFEETLSKKASKEAVSFSNSSLEDMGNISVVTKKFSMIDQGKDKETDYQVIVNGRLFDNNYLPKIEEIRKICESYLLEADNKEASIELNKQLVSKLSDIRCSMIESFERKDYKSVSDSISTILEIIPTPYSHKIPNKQSLCWRNFDIKEKEEICELLTSFVSMLFEVNIRTQQGNFTQKDISGVINARAVQMQLMKDSLELLSKQGTDLSERSEFTTILLKHNAEINKHKVPFGFYCQDMIDYFNKNVMNASGHDPSQEIRKATILDCLQSNLASYSDSEFEDGLPVESCGISFTGSYACASLKERFNRVQEGKSLDKEKQFLIANGCSLLHDEAEARNILEKEFTKNSSIIRSLATSEVLFRAMVAPGAFLQIRDKVSGKLIAADGDDFTNKVKENVALIENLLEVSPDLRDGDDSSDKPEIVPKKPISIKVRSVPFNNSTKTGLEYYFDIKDTGKEVCFSEIKRSQKEIGEYFIPGRDNLDPEQIIPEELLVTVLSNKSKVRKGDEIIDPVAGKEGFIVSPAKGNHLITEELGSFDFEQHTSTDAWLREPNVDLELTAEEQVLLSKLKVTDTTKSSRAVLGQIEKDTVKIDGITAVQALVTCIHTPSLLLRESSRRVVEQSIYHNGVISSALLSNADFFINNAKLLDEELFSKFTKDNPDAEKIMAAASMLHMREVIYSTARNLLNYLEKYKKENINKKQLCIFDVSINDINEKIDDLRKILLNQDVLKINSKEPIDWIAHKIVFGATDEEGFNEKLFYRARGYLINILKQKITSSVQLDGSYELCDSLSNIKGVSVRTIGLALGLYLKFLGENIDDHGYPEIDREALMWMQTVLAPEIDKFVKANSAGSNVLLSACDAVLSQSNAAEDFVDHWEDCGDGIYKNTASLGLSVYNGLNFGGSRRIINKLPDYDVISSAPSFKKIFGDRSIVNNIKIIKKDSCSYIEYTDEITGFVINLGWDKTKRDPLEAKLIIKEGEFKGEYTYSDVVVQKELCNCFIFRNGCWLNEDPDKDSILFINGLVNDFQTDNILRCEVKNSDDKINISKITNYHQDLVLAVSKNLNQTGILSEKLQDSLVFYKAKDPFKKIAKILLPRLDTSLELFQIGEQESWIIQSGSELSGKIDEESITTANNKLFKGSHNSILPFFGNNGVMQFVFSADNSIFRGKGSLPCLSGKIVSVAPDVYDVQTTAVGFYSLAFLAAQEKDYKSAVKFLNKAKTAVFDISEQQAFQVLVNSWITKLDGHDSKKLQPIVLKAFAVAQIINNSTAKQKLGYIYDNSNNKTLIKLLKIYSERLFDEKHVIVSRMWLRESLGSEYHLEQMYHLSEDEVEILRDLVLESDECFINFIISQLPNQKTITIQDLQLIFDNLKERGIYFENSIINQFIIEKAKTVITEKGSLNAEDFKSAIINESHSNETFITKHIYRHFKNISIANREVACRKQPKTLPRISVDGFRDKINQVEKELNTLQDLLSVERDTNDDLSNFALKLSNLNLHSKDLGSLYNSSKDKISDDNIKTAFETNLKKKQAKLSKAAQLLPQTKGGLKNPIEFEKLRQIKERSKALIESKSFSITETFNSFIDSDWINQNKFSRLKQIKQNSIFSEKDFMDQLFLQYKNGDFSDIKDVEQKISIYLLELIQEDKLQEVLRLCSTLEFSQNTFSRDEAIEWSEKILASINEAFDFDRHIDPVETDKLSVNAREQIVAEYYLNVIIRDDQKQVINSLVDGDNKLMLCPPGFGKSKVVAPVFCAIKASKGGFPIYVTTAELVRISASDLSKSNMKAFQQKRYEFSLECNLSYSQEVLLGEYDRLLEAKQQGGFVVTSMDNLANLSNLIIECKKTEQKILHSLQDKIQELKNTANVEDLDLFKLLREFSDKKDILIKIKALLASGDFLIDEADSVLNVSHWINKASGEKSKIDNNMIRLMERIFKVILQNPNKSLKIDKLSKAILSNQQSLLLENDVKDAFLDVVSCLYKDFSIFNIYTVDNKLEDDFKKVVSEQSFVDFILAKEGSEIVGIESIESKLEDKQQITTTINILRDFCSIVLPSVLKEERGKNFGYDYSTGCTVVPKSLGEELIGTRHSNPSEIAAYMFLQYAIGGNNTCSQKAFKSFFMHMDCELASQRSEEVNSFFADLDFIYLSQSTYTEDRSQLAYKMFLSPKMWKIRFEMVKKYVYEKTYIFDEQIRSNSQDFVCLADVKAAAISGTLESYSMPKIFQADKSISENVSLEALEMQLCNSYQYGEKSELEELQGDGYRDIKSKLLDSSVCAIINAGGGFDNDNSNSVVKNLRKTLDENFEIGVSSDCKDIIFVDSVTRKQMIWKAKQKRPDPLESSYNVTKCLAYYGLSDIRGTDFKLPKGKGLLLPGKNMTQEEVNQAVMRLRGFGKTQTVEIMLNKDIADAIRDVNKKASGQNVTLGEWLLKVQVDTTKNSLLNNLKQSMSDIQVHRKKLGLFICEQSFKSFDNDQFLIGKELEYQLFNLVNIMFVKLNENKFNEDMTPVNFLETTAYLLTLFDREEQHLEQLFTNVQDLQRRSENNSNKEQLQLILDKIKGAIINVKDSKAVFNANKNVHEENLQNKVMAGSTIDISEQGALATATVLEQDQDQDQDQDVALQKSLVIQRSNVKHGLLTERAVQSTGKRRRRRVTGQVYSEVEFFDTSIADRTFRGCKELSDELFDLTEDLKVESDSESESELEDQWHDVQEEHELGKKPFVHGKKKKKGPFKRFGFKFVKKPDSDCWYNQYMMEDVIKSVDLLKKHPKERILDNKDNCGKRAGIFATQIYASRSTLAEYADKKDKSPNSVMMYIASVYDPNKKEYFVQLCSDNDALMLIPALQKNKKQLSTLTEQEKIEELDRQNKINKIFDRSKVFGNKNSTYMSEKDARNHKQLHIRLYARTSNEQLVPVCFDKADDEVFKETEAIRLVPSILKLFMGGVLTREEQDDLYDSYHWGRFLMPNQKLELIRLISKYGNMKDLEGRFGSFMGSYACY